MLALSVALLTLKRLVSDGSSSPHSFWLSSINEMSEQFLSGLFSEKKPIRQAEITLLHPSKTNLKIVLKHQKTVTDYQPPLSS